MLNTKKLVVAVKSMLTVAGEILATSPDWNSTQHIKSKWSPPTSEAILTGQLTLKQPLPWTCRRYQNQSMSIMKPQLRVYHSMWLTILWAWLQRLNWRTMTEDGGLMHNYECMTFLTAKWQLMIQTQLLAWGSNSVFKVANTFVVSIMMLRLLKSVRLISTLVVESLKEPTLPLP